MFYVRKLTQLNRDKSMADSKKLNLDQINRDFDTAENYEELIVCSNALINTQHIFSTNDGWYPLVVRKGQAPRVWLSVRVLDTSNEENKVEKFIELIVDSQVKNDSVGFTSTQYGFQITVNNQVIAEAGNHDSNSLEIIKLDLRPLAMNIFGDHTSLNIGNNVMARNTSIGSHSMFGLS